MKKTLFRFLALALLLTAATRPAAAGESARDYRLHTLDYRIAEKLVWDICEENGGKSDKCRVQQSTPSGLNVFAPQPVHALIVDMLAARDELAPTSLLFEIVLVRLVDNGGKTPPPLAAHQQRALAAISEVFPGKRAEILDTGLIRTATEGQTRMGSDDGESYEAQLALRSTFGSDDGLTFSVDLSILHRGPEGWARLLASSLSIAEGETVVAGSSRTGGESAIVVLLTSTPRS